MRRFQMHPLRVRAPSTNNERREKEYTARDYADLFAVDEVK